MALIVAPPGAGKSYWIEHNPDKGWEEGDDLYPQEGRYDERTMAMLKEHERLNNEFKMEGKKVMTSDWYNLKGVDAVVLPAMREVLENSKGEQREGNDVAQSYYWLIKYAHKKDVPIFHSFDEAVDFIDGQGSQR